MRNSSSNTADLEKIAESVPVRTSARPYLADYPIEIGPRVYNEETFHTGQVLNMTPAQFIGIHRGVDDYTWKVGKYIRKVAEHIGSKTNKKIVMADVVAFSPVDARWDFKSIGRESVRDSRYFLQKHYGIKLGTRYKI